MALQKSGVQLVAEGYQQYLQQMREVNKVHKETFSNTYATQYKNGQKEVQKAAKDTSKALGSAASGGVAAFRQGLAALASGNILGGLKMLRTAIMSFKALIPELLALAGLVKIVSSFTQFAKASGDVAQRNETLLVSLQQVGATAGYTQEQIAYAEESVRKMGITTAAARQSLVQMAQANIAWTDASALARTAQDAAVIGNINSSEAFERMIVGIQRGETEILKTIGLNVSFEQSYKKLAAQLGVGTKELTEQQKAQARANAVLEAGAKISGVYANAQETSGKQAKSLERYIEETQAAAGKLMLPFRELSIQMKTMKWKGLREIAVGISQFEPVIRMILQDFKAMGGIVGKLAGALLGFKEGETIFTAIGRSIHTAARNAAILHVTFRTVGQTIAQEFQDLFSILSRGFQALISGDVRGLAAAAVDMGKKIGGEFRTDFTANLRENFVKLKAEFPDLFKDFSELGNVAEVSLERPISPADALIAKLQELKKQLEVQASILEKVEDIQRNYSKAVEKAAESYAKQLAKLEKDLAKAREKAAEKMTEALEDLEKDSAKKRAKILEESSKEEIEAQRDLYRELEQERRRFELSQLQSLRRFKLSEKRLQAEGDILGLIQLREDQELEQQEAKENYELSQTEQKEAAEEQLRKQREDIQERLKELEDEIQERRAEIQQSYQDELSELVQSNQERRAEALASYQEQLSDLKAGRADQLKELARSLADEANITDKGMKEVADKIRNVFGEDEVADELLYQWAYRAQTVMGQAMEDIKDQIASVEAQISALESGEDVSTSTSDSSTTDYGAAKRGRKGMRSGGEGEVIGPALFEVEPGVRERVAFAPVGASARNQLDVNVAGGIDVRGAEGASPGIVDAAVESMMYDFTKAVRRLTKR